MSAHFQERILGLEITPFSIIKVEFYEFPKDCWYYIKPEKPSFPGHKPHDGFMCWFKVKVQGLVTDMHTSAMDCASKSKQECQALTMKNRKWDIKSNNDFKLLEKCAENYPEWFV